MKYLHFCLSFLNRLPRKLEAVLLLLLLWQSAALFWQLAAPVRMQGNLAMPMTPPSEAPFIPTGLIKWFEVRNATTQPVVDLKLVALISGPRGVAVFSGLPDGDVAVRPGQEVRSGTRLKKINARSVDLEVDGSDRHLELPKAPDVDALLVPFGKTPASAPASASRPDSPPPGKPGGGPAAPAESKPVTVSRGAIGGAIQTGNIADWNKGIASYRDGGILVENAEIQPLAKAFNLKNGDVMKGVNGRPVNNLADISLVFNAFSQHAKVDLLVLRDGQQQTLSYQIQP